MISGKAPETQVSRPARSPCYNACMNTPLKEMLRRIDAWPAEDQEALLEAARSIEAERSGVYLASPAELAAIDHRLDDARSGRFSTDEAAAKVRPKFRGE
jgi:hypothetical protein